MSMLAVCHCDHLRQDLQRRGTSTVHAHSGRLWSAVWPSSSAARGCQLLNDSDRCTAVHSSSNCCCPHEQGLTCTVVLRRDREPAARRSLNINYGGNQC